MSKEKAKAIIEDALNYLDATVGITDSDNSNIDFVKELLDQTLKELEDE